MLQNELDDSCFIRMETWMHSNILRVKSEIENKRIRFNIVFLKNKSISLKVINEYFIPNSCLKVFSNIWYKISGICMPFIEVEYI